MKTSRSFADVAGRVTGWTSNLIATALVALLALGVGRQLVSWYRFEPSPAPPSAGVALANLDLGDAPLELEFGGLGYQVSRRMARGSVDAAAEALVGACREHLGGEPVVASGPAEQRLLELCARGAPAARGPDGAEIFRAPQGMPLVVATRRWPPGESSARPAPADSRDSAEHSAVASASAASAAGTSASAASAVGTSASAASAVGVAGALGAARRRVVVWGMATPVAADQWHLYIAYNRAASDEGDPRVRKRLSIPLPPGARKTLSIEDVHGAGLVALGGDGPASTWIGFYSEWFGTRNWRASGDWQGSAGAWRRRFVGEGEPGWIVDIEIMPAACRAPGQDVAVDKQGPRVGEIAERHPGAGRVAAFLSIAPSGAVAEK